MAEAIAALKAWSSALSFAVSTATSPFGLAARFGFSAATVAARGAVARGAAASAVEKGAWKTEDEDTPEEGVHRSTSYGQSRPRWRPRQESNLWPTA